MSTNGKQFYQCSSCKGLFLSEPNTSKSCINCGKGKLNPIDGRFILRCKKCGLTQNKPAFAKLHGENALKCQSSTCNGSIKLIQLRKRSNFSTPIASQPKQPPSPKIDIGKSIIKTLKEVHPPVPKRRELAKKPFVDNYDPFPSENVSNDKIDEETFMPFPSSAPKP